MSTTKLNSLSAIALALLLSCGPKSESAVEQNETTQVEETEKATEENHDLVLNNGEAWEANPETTKGVLKMMAALNGFQDHENTKSYAVLTDSLESSFRMIFQKCTMKGEAHNQLHNFLIPIKNEFEGLRSEDIKVCKASFHDLQEHMTKYEQFFKTAPQV